MKFLGDIHGNYSLAFKLANSFPNEEVIQIGDFGFGFQNFPAFPTNLKFIRGNHDSPNLCRTHPNYLGEYGRYKQIFFVSGADSVDKNMRIEGKSWWRDEELSYSQAESCLSLWKRSKSPILVAHDAPQFIVEGYFLIYDRCLTRNLLQEMIKARKPEVMIFGHHHRSFRINYEGVRYFGLNCEEVLDI